MMKNIVKNASLLSLFILLFLNQSGFAQETDADNFKMLFYFNMTKTTDNSRLLDVEFLARNKENKKDKIAVVAAPIEFYHVADGDEELLGTAVTDKKGKTSFKVSADQKYFADEDGYITLLARFPGSDALDEEEEEIMFMDLNVSLELETEDDVTTAFVTAFTIDSSGAELPVEELDIILGVEGMLSGMPLDEGTIEEGEYEFEMPDDIPGDPIGSYMVYVQVDDHEDFINVYSSTKVEGNQTAVTQTKSKNLLWTDAAPIWMYVVLTILLVGIWANFAYTIRNLFRIKQMGDN